MGIHTGEADLAVDRYVGLSVHRAARICAVGHGGQVLVSQTTVSHLEDDEEDLPGIALRDLGEHRLKDISRPVRLYQLDIDGLRTRFPPLSISERPKPNRRKRIGLAAAALLIAGAIATTLALVSRDQPPPKVLPNSLVRIDPNTLKPTEVVRIGDAPDIVVAAGGYLWVTHHILRDFNSNALRNAGDRTLTRVDPSTGDAVVVGGGLAPCGLTADPSGDVWVANCYASGSGPSANVVRIDASTLEFKATWRVPAGKGYYRGLAYGGGSLWVTAPFGDTSPNSYTLTEIDPRTGAQRLINLNDPATGLAWSDGYGDLWMSSFNYGSVTRMHAATRVMKRMDRVALQPGGLVADGDVVWVGDWAAPRVVRLPAVGSSKPRTVSLPLNNTALDVWSVAANADGVWATTPSDGALWRIDPKTNHVTRITIPFLPTFVAVDADGGLWVTVRGA
jgi:streptogramin lyase